VVVAVIGVLLKGKKLKSKGKKLKAQSKKLKAESKPAQRRKLKAASL
jgi:hypothetical protein